MYNKKQYHNISTWKSVLTTSIIALTSHPCRMSWNILGSLKWQPIFASGYSRAGSTNLKTLHLSSAGGVLSTLVHLPFYFFFFFPNKYLGFFSMETSLIISMVFLDLSNLLLKHHSATTINFAVYKTTSKNYFQLWLLQTWSTFCNSITPCNFACCKLGQLFATQ